MPCIGLKFKRHLVIADVFAGPSRFPHNVTQSRAQFSNVVSPKTLICSIKAERNDYSVTGSSDSLVVRRCASEEELLNAARIRAEAYHEDRVFGRFTQSFIKQYTEQEYRRLLAEANTSPLACIVLVAIETTNNTCVGSLDLCLDAQSQSELGADILQGGVYIQNVAVSIDKRGRGVGRCLVENAKEYAMEQGGVPIYAHVDAANGAAISLYRRCGFDNVEERRKIHSTEYETSLGRKLLLSCYPHRSVTRKT